MSRSIFVRISAIAFFHTAAFLNATAALDPVPTVTDTVCEGFTHKELHFKDGDRRVIYQLPDKWSYRGSESGIQLRPGEQLYAEALIRMAPLSKPQSLDEKGVEGARQRFLASLPPGSQAIKLIKEEANPLMLNNSPSCEFTVSYQALGETFLRSALFTNVFDTQFVFVFTARTSDFEALHRAFRQSLCSWEWRDDRSASANKSKIAAAPAPPAPSAN